MHLKRILLFSILLVFSIAGIGQITTTTIGNGGTTNGSTQYPAPYGNWYFGAKHQMLIRASELQAQGMSAGNILSLAFNVSSAVGTQLEDFTISIKNTSSTNVSGGFETGLTTVYGPSNYTESNGWNTHTFSSPFYWNGTSNLLIETCFNNSNYTQNAEVFQSSTSFASTIVYREDATGVCSNTSPTGVSTENQRPNIRFQWESPNAPPVTNFNASSTTTCSGEVQFYDQSSNNPTSWSWDFGDGNSSTDQNPSHTYASSGTYTVSLTAGNQFGSDDEVKTDYITVNLIGSTPIASQCTPATQDGTLGFGINNVSFNTLNINSGNASEGYSDFTCDQTTVYAGHSYEFSATHPNPTTHNCAAWIDWNNDGILDNTNELIASSSSTTVTTSTVTIPSNAVQGQPLRMRVIADYDLNAMPEPCTDPGYGQAEDFTIKVEQYETPPEADFIAAEDISCTGMVEFEDLSTNVPNAWSWDFGDGNTSIAQNPTHTYSADGTYDVTLISTNQYGTDTITKTAYVTIQLSANVIAVDCEPQTLANCCGYGIYQVQLGGMSGISEDGSEGYQDFTCRYGATLEIGNTYLLTVRTGPDNPQDTKVWVDWNNDGSFDAVSELVMDKPNTYNPSTNLTIPTSGIVTSTNLRMRVSSDEVGSTLTPCSDVTRGQVEDYTLNLSPVGIEEPGDIEFKMYPNPVSSELTIETSHGRIESIQIFNMLGELIFTPVIDTPQQRTTINTTNLSNGTYFVNVLSSEESRATMTLIKVQ